MNEEPNVDLTLSGALNFTYKISLHQAAQIIAFVSTGEASSDQGKKPLLILPQTGPARFNAPGSAIDAIKQSGAKTYPQKIAALGSFIINRNGTDTFDQKELSALLRRMGDTPQNFSRDLNNAELLGYVTREPNGEYFLTDKAREAIEAQFADATSIGGTSRKKRTRRKADDVAAA